MLATDKMVMHDDDDCKFTLEFHRRYAYFHLEIKVWNKRVYRKILAGFGDALRVCRSIGCRGLRVVCPAENRLLPKFASRFGFVAKKRNELGLLLEI